MGKIELILLGKAEGLFEISALGWMTQYLPR